MIYGNLFGIRFFYVALSIAFVLGSYQLLFADESSGKKPITEADVNAAQQEWCDGLVQIGKVHAAGGDIGTKVSRHLALTLNNPWRRCKGRMDGLALHSASRLSSPVDVLERLVSHVILLLV